MKTTMQEFLNEQKELIVSYDCTGAHKPLGTRLLEYLRDELKSDPINKSLYKVPGLHTESEIIAIRKKIESLFISAVNEIKDASVARTKIMFLIPDGTKFTIRLVLLADGSSKKL